MVTLVSFDIDGTLEVGDTAGIVSIALVKTAKRLGYLVGSCSDRPISHHGRVSGSGSGSPSTSRSSSTSWPP